jgi:hypothetical protein
LKLDLLNLDELEELIQLSKNLAIDNKPDSTVFDSIVNSVDMSQVDILIDGANVAHYNQNFDEGFFRFDQIARIIQKFPDSKIKIILHEKWCKPDRELKLKNLNKNKKRKLPQIGSGSPHSIDLHDAASPYPPPPPLREPAEITPPVDLIQKWRNEKILIEIPSGENDDWYWIYLALVGIRDWGHGVRVVSNDQLRDHFWRIHRNENFNLKFIRNYFIKFNIQENGGSEIILSHPPKFTKSIQILDSGNVYIPTTSNGWLLVRKQ